MKENKLALPPGARPALRFTPPSPGSWLLAVSPLVSWLYVRFALRVRREELHGMEHIVRAYQELQDGRSRVIVAFRHPGTEDPPVVFRLMTGIVARQARRLGVRLRRPPRGYFLYGRDIPEWAGRYLYWLFPLLGAISVVPGRYDSRSLSSIRRFLTDMPHPVALAPEGQVTYHNDRVAALEPGTAQLAFWCLEDLRKQSRREEVLIVPVCTSYHYDPRGWSRLMGLLAATERECGLPPWTGEARPAADAGGPAGDPSPVHAFTRVTRLLRRLVGLAEDFYARFYGARFASRGAVDTAEEPAEELQERIHAVCNAALGVAESFFHAPPRGDFVQRVFATRQAGLTWMFREDLPDLDTLSPVERALADRVALETWLANRHVELVDLLEYLRTDYLQPDSGFDRFVEYVTSLQDLANRLEGGNISGRVNPLSKTARIIVGEPLRVSPRWESYKGNRRQAVLELTADILARFSSVAENGNNP